MLYGWRCVGLEEVAEVLQKFLVMAVDGIGARWLQRSDGDAMKCCYVRDACGAAGRLRICEAAAFEVVGQPKVCQDVCA